MSPKKEIVLATLNARYIHSAFGLRYLKANLGEYEARCALQEFTLDARPADVVESLLAEQPSIVGLSVYIWNVRQTEQVVTLLKTVAPNVVIVLGGPEVSHEIENQPIVQLADYVITGWGEVSFKKLVAGVLTGDKSQPKLINGEQPPLKQIGFPYRLYSDQDIQNRVIYVEASRGCPFKCEFCLSALDKTAWPFELEKFLQEMDGLYQRGARHFKFVDRTFNLKIKHSVQILEFFLARLDDQLFLHFELIPDHLPDALKELIAKFPKQSLQFEVGIQTFNPQVQSRIGRKQNNAQARDNLEWILQHTQAHVHTDLIFGLPGESLKSFAQSFDQLCALGPHEIQVGILKRLKGSPIIRHTEPYALTFNPEPPFNILSSSEFDFLTQQRVARFARYWDLIGNSGRFRESLPLLLGAQPFQRFMQLSDELYRQSGQTHKISLPRLIDLVFAVGGDVLVPRDELMSALQVDFEQSGLKSIPACLRDQAPNQARGVGKSRLNHRQARH